MKTTKLVFNDALWAKINRNITEAFCDGNLDPVTFGDCVGRRDERMFRRIDETMLRTGLDIIDYSDEECCMGRDLRERRYSIG